MRRSFSLAPVVFVFGLSTTAFAQQAPSDYAIKFERPFTEGQSFAVKVSDTNHAIQNVALPDGTASHTETTKVLRLDCDLLIEKVDPRGLEQNVLVTIHRFSRQAPPAAAIELLPANTHLHVEYQGEIVLFSLDDGKISDDANTALQQVFKPHKANRITDDQRYGTTARKKVGESWPVDVNALTRDRTPAGAANGGVAAPVLDPKNVTGDVTLKAIRTVPALNNVECAEIEARVQIKNIPVQGLTPKESAMGVVVTNFLPTNPKTAGLSTTIRTTMHVLIEQSPAGVVGRGEAGGGIVRTTVDSDLTRTSDWRPMQ